MCAISTFYTCKLKKVDKSQRHILEIFRVSYSSFSNFREKLLITYPQLKIFNDKRYGK